VQRFPDVPVLAALAQRAVATTLVTAEGRRLTEVTLTVQNQARPFLKVALPAGATLLSAEVAGQSVKPLSGADGARVPLLRPGFRPQGPYAVSFVVLESGASLAKKGEGQVSLPRFDMPVGVLEWELFLPDKYRVKRFAGDALGSERWAQALPSEGGGLALAIDGLAGGVTGGIAETVEVVAEAPQVTTQQSFTLGRSGERQLGADKRAEAKAAPAPQAPSVNVVNLQRRVAGVLPVRLDVPRAGTAYHLVRPLVVDEETRVSFKYKAR
jgi:hypothetical protein